MIILGTIGYVIKGGKVPEKQPGQQAQTSSQTAPPVSHSQDTSDTGNTDSAAPSADTTTQTGTIECVPEASNNSIHTTDCAIGLRSDSGEDYALYTEDPTEFGTLPTGQRVQVTGPLLQTDRYGLAGIIDVQTVEKL